MGCVLALRKLFFPTKQKTQNPSHKKFQFDLELQIKDKPAEGKKLLEKAEKRIQEVHSVSKKDANEKDLEILLNGYTALQKILKKLSH